jgi:hypothetical protein
MNIKSKYWKNSKLLYNTYANNSLTLLGPVPTYISMKSEPVQKINSASHSPAVAFANKVFPVPGGP